MSSENSSNWPESIDRRKFIASGAAGTIAGLAGCPSGGGGSSGGTGGGGGGSGSGGGSGGESGAATTESEEIIRGGKPIMGGTEPVKTFNILSTNESAGIDASDLVYTFGVIPDPKTARPIPWGFTDWELKPENVGTDSPTITAEIRDDLVFHDGKKVTAEDPAFTYQFMKEQNTAGDHQPRQEVEEVVADNPKGTTVNFFLKEKTAVWNTQILLIPFLPKHIWKNVPDYTKYAPRKEPEGVVGSSPLKVKDYNWPSWIEYEMRPEEEMAQFNQDDRYDFLHPKGPFINGLRFELFQSRSSAFQALDDGRIDLTSEAVTLNRAVTAKKSDALEVKQAVDSDFAFHAWNMRRVPFDDKAFRQFLVKCLNQKWLIEKNFKGIGANKGTYSTSTMYKDWRPPEPSELTSGSDDPYNAGEYEGITIPDLDWPSDSLKFGSNTPQEDIDALREFLLNHPEAKHDYSLGDAASDEVSSPDGKAIYINGKPITEAHTDNDGNPGQGPLEMSMGPPEKDPLAFPRADNWVSTLNRVGVPVQRSIEPWSSQYPKIYINENFDMYEQDWGNSLVWPQTHIGWQFHSSGADLKQGQSGSKAGADDEAPQWNSMPYTNADDLIAEATGMMDHKKRQPIVKKVFAQVYQDCPEMVTSTYNNLFPVSKEWKGYVTSNVDMVGRGIINYLSLRKDPDQQS